MAQTKSYVHRDNITIINDDSGQLSDIKLRNFVTKKNDDRNVDDDCLVHVTISKVGSARMVELFLDEDRTILLCQGFITTDDGVVDLSPASGRRLEGSVKLEYVQDDATIKLRPFYTLDEDLILYEKAIEEWLPYPDRFEGPEAFGFAVAHARAKWETEKLLREFRSADLPAIEIETNLFVFTGVLFDPFFFGLRGDLTQRVPDFQFLLSRSQLVELTTFKALYFLSWHQKNKNPENGQWADLALWYQERWRNEARHVNLDFDLDQDGRIDFISEVSDNRVERG